MCILTNLNSTQTCKTKQIGNEVLFFPKYRASKRLFKDIKYFVAICPTLAQCSSQ